jgi:hypothetical protein
MIVILRAKGEGSQDVVGFEEEEFLVRRSCLCSLEELYCGSLVMKLFTGEMQLDRSRFRLWGQRLSVTLLGRWM